MTLEEKKNEFMVEARTSALNKYSDEMINDFIEYWCEPNRTKKKLRFEAQKFFSMGRRLATWARNEKKWNTPKIKNMEVNEPKVIQANFLKDRYGVG